MSHVSRPWTLWIAVALFAILAVTATPVGWMMLRAPHADLLGMPADLIARTPFRSWLIPGIFLFGLLGLGSLCAVYGLLVRPGWGWPQRLNPFRGLCWEWTFATGIGLAIMVWITVQVLTFPIRSIAQPLYFALGLVIVVLMVEPHMRHYFAVAPKPATAALKQPVATP